MGFHAEVLADSISPDGVRLTTVVATFPRFILSEVNTHRTLSRNSASSRAIPTEKQIQRVLDDPFVPMTFNQRIKGMGVGDVLDPQYQTMARAEWLGARDSAVRHASFINDLNVDKSRVNRLLEPFLWHTAIISATEWSNFFALRDHPAAQPEFQEIARMMQVSIEESEPKQLNYGWWHLPLVSDLELRDLCAVRQNLLGDDDRDIVGFYKKISASRCARVSFDKHTEGESFEATIQRADRLLTAVPPHLSPFEHVARPLEPEDYGTYYHGCSPEEAYVGNFRGWVQMRKEIKDEDDARKIIDAAKV